MLAGVEKSHPSVSPCRVEEPHSGNRIRALPHRSKVRWPQTFNSLTFAVNCTVHETEEDEQISLSGDSMSVAGGSQSSVDEDTGDRTVSRLPVFLVAGVQVAVTQGALGWQLFTEGGVVPDLMGVALGTPPCLQFWVCGL